MQVNVAAAIAALAVVSFVVGIWKKRAGNPAPFILLYINLLVAVLGFYMMLPKIAHLDQYESIVFYAWPLCMSALGIYLGSRRERRTTQLTAHW